MGREVLRLLPFPPFTMALPPPSLKAKLFTAALLFLVLPAGCVYMLSGDPDPKYANKTTAVVCAQMKVKEQLKSPSTADFQPSIDMQIETTDNLSYKIAGYVDSQNGFGAMVRSNFVCDLTVHPESESCTTGCQLTE